MLARLNCFLCCGAAAASYAAFLPHSPPLAATALKQLPARVGPLTMHMYEPPEPRNWARGQGEHSAAYRRARRARIFAEHQSAFADARHAQPQSSAAHPSASDSASMAHGLAPMAHGLEPTRVVLIFDAGRPHEGAYTQMEPDGSHTIFAFEDEADAHRFGQLLVAKGFDMPTPQHWPRSRMRIFLGENKDLSVRVVPRGTTPDAPSEFRDDNKLAGPDRSARPDQYTSHRLWLEQLMGMHVDNCGDDDCILG